MDKAAAAFTQALPHLAFYSALKDRAQRERHVHLGTVSVALLVEGTPLVEEIVDGLFIRSSMDEVEGEDIDAYRVGVRIWKYAVESNLSIRPSLRLPRQCTQRDLRDTRTRLTPYTAETLTVSGGSIHQTTATVTQLKEIVVNQVQLASAEGNYKHTGIEKCIRVVSLHAQPCSLPCYLWHSKRNRRGLDRGCCHECYI